MDGDGKVVGVADVSCGTCGERQVGGKVRKCGERLRCGGEGGG